MYELILYFEPAKNTPLRQCLDSILSTIACSYYPSTAFKYPIHVSVTGFFTVNTHADVNFVIDTYNHFLSMEKNQQHRLQTPTLDLNPITISDIQLHDDEYCHSRKHLLLPVTVPDDFRLLLTQCADKVNNKYSAGQQQQQQQKARQIRPKRIDHISLAYWDEPKATTKETNDWLQWSNGTRMEEMKHEVIQRLQEFQSPFSSVTPWDMVLYERTYKGEGVGEKHEFQEWSRWRLKD